MTDDDGRWGRSGADVLLAEALAARGASGAPALLWDAGTFVYRVGDLVAKVYGPAALLDRHERAAVAGARLAEAGVPLVAPLDDGRLVRRDAGAVGFWPFLESVRAATWRDLGALLRACHDTPADVLWQVDLPRWDPVVATRWATMPYRDRRDADPELADAIDETGEALTGGAALLADTPGTLIHGDAQLQNVIVGASGPRLIDLDWLAVGPIVADTAIVVREHRRGVLSEAEYAAFVETYGSDPSSLSGTDALVAVVDFNEVLFRLALACRRAEPVEWLSDAVTPMLG